MGTGWSQKIASNKRIFFKLLKRAMATLIFFFSLRIPSSSPLFLLPALLTASPTPNYHQQQT